MVKHLPFADIEVPVPGFGAMGLNAGFGTNLSYDEAEPVLLKAIELGCTFWDTAVCRNREPVFTQFQATYTHKVVYRAGVNEKILGDFIRKHNVRDKVFGAWQCLVLFLESNLEHMALRANGWQLLQNAASTCWTRTTG
jgi:aryl-alcohol dehydrogenase-like predicted oxidoreductase